MNIWHDIDPKRVTSKEFIAVVEITSESKNKYELDKETGLLRLDRVLYTATHYPANYGFIPLTYAEDHDPLDVLIICSQPLLPLTLVRCRPIGVLKMKDDGEGDEKIIAVCLDDPAYEYITTIHELPLHVFKEFKHFFEVYKILEGKKTVVEHIHNADIAERIIQECIDRYISVFGDKKEIK